MFEIDIKNVEQSTHNLKILKKGKVKLVRRDIFQPSRRYMSFPGNFNNNEQLEMSLIF